MRPRARRWCARRVARRRLHVLGPAKGLAVRGGRFRRGYASDELDGPCVYLTLSGRFWHRRETVLANAAAFLRQRIPEIADVDVRDAVAVGPLLQLQRLLQPRERLATPSPPLCDARERLQS